MLPATVRRIAALMLPGLALAAAARAGQETATGDVARAVTPCAAAQICGMRDPEDLADVAGTRWLMVSEAAEGKDSGLAALDTTTRALIRFRADALGPSCLPGARGGGIGVRREGGGYRLVRILHGARSAEGGDAVESFRLTIVHGGPQLTRIACVTAPAPFFLNDIAVLPDGGFAATHMFDPATPRAAREAAFLAGAFTGYVVRWSPGTGWRRLPGTEGTFPNGIDATPDGRWLAFAEIYGHTINRIRADGSARATIRLAMNPDNVTAAAGGRFVVVGGTGQPLVSTRRCPELRRPGCGFPARAMLVDFARGTSRALAIGGGASVPGFSVGVVKRGRLYLGTAFGDRITTVALIKQATLLP